MRPIILIIMTIMAIMINGNSQTQHPVIVEIKHSGDDSLGAVLIDKLIKFINDSPDYQLRTNDVKRFQIYINTMDPLKGYNEHMENIICSAGYTFVLRTMAQYPSNLNVYITSGLISFGEDQLEYAANKILNNFGETVVSQLK